MSSIDEKDGENTIAPVDGIVSPDEYASAIDLIHGVRGSSECAEMPGVRHWGRPSGRICADFFCCADHPGFGRYFLFADASGHGLSSAIFSLHTPMLFRESVLIGMSLGAIYLRIHQFLISQNLPRYHVCGLLVRVKGRDLEIINAGMPEALLLSNDGNVVSSFPAKQLPMGAMRCDSGRDSTQPQHHRLFRDEQLHLLMYSDGLNEIVLADGKSGDKGVRAAARNGAANLHDELRTLVEASAATIHDDVSIAMVSLPLHEPTRGLEYHNIGAHLTDINLDALQVIENLCHGLLLTDAAQQIIYANPAFCRQSGYSSGEVVGMTPRLLRSGRHETAFYHNMWCDLRDKGAWSGEIWNRRKDGSLYLEWLDIRTILNSEGDVESYIATYSALGEKRLENERLLYMAMHDPLTGLANRTLLIDRSVQAIKRADRKSCSLAVLFIDLDRFKAINDSLGHDAGDEALLAISRRLTAVLREEDTLARFGGNEFICLVPDINDRHDVMRIANRFLALFEKPFELAGRTLKISASIGISTYPTDALDFDDLLVLADRAMQRAKQAGGNLFRFFSPEMAVRVQHQLEIESRLHNAIEVDGLDLHFQPQFDLATSRFIGAEALVRWFDKEHGSIPPGDFIPIAEKSDLIARIGNWVLRRACAMLATHTADLPADFHIAVNVSPLQFERYDLANEVMLAIESSGIEPSRLQLEVTESLLIRDLDAVAAMLQRIADLGVGVALDDFGTGYSNLASIGGLPLRAFKLDQSFVRGIDSNQSNAMIAKSVWNLADGLGKHVIAEGVETCSECQKLSKLGYRLVQGYRFGKPMVEKDLLLYLKNWRDSEYACISSDGDCGKPPFSP